MDIKKPKDPTLLNDFEKKHIPVVKLPKKVIAGKEMAIKVKIGEVPHLQIPEHYITWVALYEGEKLLQKKNIKPTDNIEEIKFTFTPTEDKELACRAECGIHGIWEQKFTVKISK